MGETECENRDTNVQQTHFFLHRRIFVVVVVLCVLLLSLLASTSHIVKTRISST